MTIVNGRLEDAEADRLSLGLGHPAAALEVGRRIQCIAFRDSKPVIEQGTFNSTTQGYGIGLGVSNTAGSRFYADDNGTVFTPSGSVGDIRNVLARTLITTDHDAVNARVHSLMGHLKTYNADWGQEQWSAVHGYLELVRASGTHALDDYGITAGLMSTVENSGAMTVNTYHVLAGVAAVSKMTSDLVQTGNTVGVLVDIYDTTNWSDGTARSKWKKGLFIKGDAVTEGINVGEFHSTTTGSGVALSVASCTCANRFYADDADTAFTPSGSVGDIRNVLARTLITADHDAVNARCHSLMGHLKAYDGWWGNEQWSAVHGYMELVRNAGTLTLDDYGISAGVMATIENSGTSTVGTNHVLAGVAAVSKLTSGLTQTGVTSAFYAGIYNTSQWSDGTARSKWSYGLYIDGSSVDSGIKLSAITLATAGTNYGFYMETTSASTNASTSVEAMYVKSTLTGAGGVGGRSRFHTYSNVASGAWVNGLKGYMEFGSSGRTTGLASGICGEINITAGCTAGTYAALEAELTCATGAAAGSGVAFLYCNASGAGAAAVNGATGYFAIIDTGVTDTSGGVVEAEVVGACASTHKLKIKVLGVDMWIPLNTAKNA